MAKAKKKIGVIDFVVLGVLVVCLVLSIVGLSIDQWAKLENVDEGVSFSEYFDAAKEQNEAMEQMQSVIDELEEQLSKLEGLPGYEVIEEQLDAAQKEYNEFRLENSKMIAMVAFAIITVILVAVTLVLYVLKMLLNVGLFRFLVLVAGVLALIAAIITIALAPGIAELSFMVVGAGAALLAVGGMLGGIAGGASFFLSKK